ncbi:hypothetical protein HMPREF1210_00590 [Paenisporosarcina sp. HGH0030]|nr:hypothetical protein HMPREF1210_00520 [Paenisporosarcina sp. HGH0030]EPD53767.1 hypothetical protein HMPREF1210_00590 [Paenisporosarcina sp. HGH0030]
MKCLNCEGFNEKIPITSPYQYFNLLNQLKAIISQGTLVLIEGNCDINDLKSGGTWPNDNIYHTFQCEKCTRKYQLSIETYHGSNGEWDIYKN